VAVDGPRVVAVSANTPLDRTDAAALTPDGRLHLALTRDAHERLGLVGARSRTGAGAPRFSLSSQVRAGEQGVACAACGDTLPLCTAQPSGSATCLGADTLSVD
jgi:hypothetical protein